MPNLTVHHPPLACHGHAGSQSSEAQPCTERYNPGVHDSSVIVIFIAAPGFRKTDICMGLKQRLDHRQFCVIHCVPRAATENNRGRFWRSVNSQALTTRRDGRMTVVLADRSFEVCPGAPPAPPPPVLHACTCMAMGRGPRRSHGATRRRARPPTCCSHPVYNMNSL